MSAKMKLAVAIAVTMLIVPSLLADSKDRTRAFRADGRISKVHRDRGGYRVWVGAVPHPFFIPSSHYRRDRFRVGRFIDIAGYYNPRGYYDVYDRKDQLRFTRATLRGVVESVDERAGTMVVYNDPTDGHITVRMRGGDRDLRELRTGDHIELAGEWTRTGYFDAYDFDFVEE